MLDPRPALADMASQIRDCRAADGLTLQQLATRSGVAASTIHKIEAQQMVPTVSVLLKIAKGLDRRPETLVRDMILSGEEDLGGGESDADAIRRPDISRIQLADDESLPGLDLESHQRAIIVIEEGAIELRAGADPIRLGSGECIEVEGGRPIDARSVHPGQTRLTLIVSPPSSAAQDQGALRTVAS